VSGPRKIYIETLNMDM